MAETINVAAQMLTNAQTAISDYKTAIDGINESVSGAVSGLVGKGYVGSAAESFSTFYSNKINTLLTTDLEAMLKQLTDLCESIKNGFTTAEGVDEKVSEGNMQSAQTAQ
ncbi:MAG: hypothetical protein IJK24_08340 [Oscillospiraceae bacterium]|nr:hypothetical protein [Oscillospiraceae bacterium]